MDNPEMTVTVRNRLSLHARPAAELVSEAQKFGAELYLWHGNQSADAKSILDVLALQVPPESHLCLSARGADANMALHRLAQVLSGCPG